MPTLPQLANNSLLFGTHEALLELPTGVGLESCRNGGLLRWNGSAPGWRFEVDLGTVTQLRRFVCCYRYEPFWMKPRVGVALDTMPCDTQYALVQRTDGQYLLLVPWVNSSHRCSLFGRNGRLWVTADTGKPTAAPARDVVLCYVALGADPYVLLKEAARDVAIHLDMGRLRIEKRVPDFVDRLGWCTWDAYYRNVTADDVLAGLESFQQGGIRPRFVILDDGWQHVTDSINQGRLLGFGANDKFPEGLSPVVRSAKENFGVEIFMVWHAVHGYWGGADPARFANYDVRPVLRWYSPELLSHTPTLNVDYWGPVCDVPHPTQLFAFYRDYHRCLAESGVDGVKVDNQASVEGLAHSTGGRVVDMAATRLALEESAAEYFDGRLINCMSCSNDMLYMTRHSTVTRTSTDFWPNLPESHGQHLYTNVVVSLWFGEFVLPDWDMFQSGHEAGGYHAAARAISGGPVYVSDTPDGHDFEVLRQLTLSDGRIARAIDIARPTRDCLFVDPTEEPRCLAVYNTNPGGYVLGIFHAGPRGAKSAPVPYTIELENIPPAAAAPHACHLHHSGALVILRPGQPLGLELRPLGWEVATLAPLRHGFAALGLEGKLNMGATLDTPTWNAHHVVIGCRDRGRLVCFSEHAPASVSIDGAPLCTTYDEHLKRLTVEVPASCRVSIVLPPSSAET